MNSQITSLPVVTDGGCGCGCSSNARNDSTVAKEPTVPASRVAGTTTFAVTGLTCGHCASAVSTELNNLAGVTDVRVDVVAGGVSTVVVRTEVPVAAQSVAAALQEAGDYRLVGS